MTTTSEQLVEAIMHKGVIGCKPSTSLEEVIRIMADTNVEVLVVTGPDEEALGVLRQLDLLPFYGQNLSGLRARDVMHTKVIAIPPEMTVKEAAGIMIEQGISDVGLRALGVLTTGHVIKAMRGKKWMWYFSPEP
jgi:CBS domain-containing protein